MEDDDDDDEDIGPWEPRFPVLNAATPLKAKPLKRAFPEPALPRSPAKSPAKAFSVAETNDASVQRVRIPALVPLPRPRYDSPPSLRNRESVVVTPKDIVFPYRKPTKRPMLDCTAPILRPRPESDLAAPSKDLIKVQKRSLSPDKESLRTVNVGNVRDGSKVLAGRMMLGLRREDSRMRALMDALEQRLNRILGNARHRSNMSVS